MRMVAVGLERLGLDEFLEGKYWSGDLYIDESHSTYKNLALKRFGLADGYGMLDKSLYSAVGQAEGVGFKGNLKGDGFQLGATFVILKSQEGHEIVFEHRQTSYADHPKSVDIVTGMKLAEDVIAQVRADEDAFEKTGKSSGGGSSSSGPKCDGDVCTR